jgi:hypothetical protein
MVDKYANKDMDFLEVSAAHEILKKKRSFLPDYSRTTKDNSPSFTNSNISHGYLMKIIIL